MIIDKNKITKIYMGRDRICRCGCAGEYVERGEPMFDLRLKRFIRMAETYTVGQDDIGDNYINLSYGQDRALTVYFD
jgi:hypothetical protein